MSSSRDVSEAPQQDNADHLYLRSVQDAENFVAMTPDLLHQTCSEFGFTPMHYACDDPTPPSILQVLASACPETLERKCFFGCSPIDLALKRIGDCNDDEEAIATLLHHFRGEELAFQAGYCNCSIGTTICEILGSSSCIQFLDLSKVHVTSEGLIALFHAIETNHVLQDLTINFFEGINANVCQALQEMLRRNTNLRSFNLRVRMFEKNTQQMIQEALESAMIVNETLHYLTFDTVPRYQLRLLLSENPAKKGVCDDCWQIDRSRLNFFLDLNRSERAALRNHNASKEQLASLLARCSDDMSVTYCLLGMVPHLINRD